MSILDRALNPTDLTRANPNGSPPSVKEVIGTPLENETPADFFKRRMAAPKEPVPVTQTPSTHPVAAVTPTVISDAVVAARAPKDVPPIDYTKPAEPAPVSKEDSQVLSAEDLLDKELTGEEKPKEEIPEIPNGTPENSVEENLSKLRKSKNEIEKKYQESQTEAEALRAKVSQYEAGEIHAPVLEEQQKEIERLRPFEALVSLKTSKEYQETFVKPITEKEQKLKDIAKDYGLPEHVMSSALNLTNRKELGQFLSTHFADVDALEVKDLIKDIQTIQGQAKEAEAKPLQALDRIKAEQEVIRNQQKAERGKRIAAVSKKGWTESMSLITKEGKLKAFIPDPSNPKHNQEIVGPVSTAAAKEYARLVRGFFDAGLEELPENMAFALARMCQLAHSSSIHETVASVAIQERNEVVETMRRRTPMNNPGMGGGSPLIVRETADSKPALTLKEQSTQLLRNVGVKI